MTEYKKAGFDPRFDYGATYTPEEFLLKARTLTTLFQGDVEILGVLNTWIDWVGPNNAGLISWEEDQSGVMHPVRSIFLYKVLPKS